MGAENDVVLVGDELYQQLEDQAEPARPKQASEVPEALALGRGVSPVDPDARLGKKYGKT